MDVKCPHCGEDYIVEASEYGKFVKCETCGKGFVVGSSAMNRNGQRSSMNTARTVTHTAHDQGKKMGRPQGDTGMKHMTRLAIVGICLILATRWISMILNYYYKISKNYDMVLFFNSVITIIDSVGWVMILTFFIALYRRQRT